ncbi:IMP4, U3 small nucleolar ribonucleoprotein protein IMP4 [Babesia microti strain RI]|uniref:IMP4, U3 small nucleolar ribonucleoprotein protein IMP4 n=1 Tax=Babesia microti (strain RI) TaxID=1133968 RepID=A0A1R4ACE8_BABMR|nr:IMP4, U3 small nucleolar ribonucleoprotein protein IMP4 [Babesia microti strain RI]SJK86689.1 IMP4, U3 small nucleolar ribonucleoprotein protein IMP4 [Babesia microti strain RI]|eukprot:XP_021338815.1 IMP4, U3 small nucleolar ribonucleoprotein protein IMP4 [Babesia microti strain RI]
MFRASARERKEYLYRKSQEFKNEELKLARELKQALKDNKPIPSHLRNKSGEVLSSLDLLDDKIREAVSHIDDEYTYAGEPKVLITTSRDPSSRLLQFVKELRLMIPNSERLNRGSYILKDLIFFAKAKQISDVVLVHEHRGQPDAMIVSHLPSGPTAYFQLSDVKLRHDLPEKPPTLSEAYPHLIFHNFTTKLGLRVRDILRYLFPPANMQETRVLSFINERDIIHFRHHVWNSKENNVLYELGPRFSLRIFRIDLGTMDMKSVETEWAYRSFINKQADAL